MKTLSHAFGLALLLVVWLPPLATVRAQDIQPSMASPAAFAPAAASSVLTRWQDDHLHADWPGTAHDEDLPGGFWEELFQPADHAHFSRRGTPLVHLFLTEPAVLHRDLFLDYRVGNNVEGSTDEQELEFEMEYALTKRLGMVLEIPYVWLDPAVGPDTSGFADIAVAGRALLVDGDLFFMSANLEVEVPTGDPGRGLGRGEAALAPTATVWLDLGNWTALHGQFGPEVGLQTGNTEFIHNVALTRSFLGPALFGSLGGGRRPGGEGDHEDHEQHFEPGFTSLILEMTGVTGLSGPDSGQTFIELLPGIAHTPAELIELRFGVRVPVFKPARLDTQYIFTVARVF